MEVIGTTEDRVQVFDWQRWAVIDEILLMTGCEMPASRQVPLLDTHSRYDSSSVLGSYRDMRVEADQLVGRSYFSTAPEAEGPYLKMKEGHLTDFSVGYRVIESTWVDDGEKAVIGGRTFDGPVSVVTRWRVKELSICPIGADERAKARTEPTPKPKQEKTDMNEKLRKYLEGKGLRADATEDEAWKYLEKLDVKTEGPDVDAERAEAARVERERVIEVRAMCDQLEMGDMADGLIKDAVSIEDARRQVMDKMIAQKKELAHRGPATHGADEKDKFRAAAEDAILIRAGMIVEKPAVGADDLTGYSLRELARHSLQIANRPMGGGVLEMVGRAMTTSDFPYLLANVANKSLFQGFETAAETYETWVDNSGSVPDFKTNYMPRVSESSDLDEIPEDTEYKYGKRTEAQETYKIATYGKIFAISRQCVINDDLNALTTIAASHGEACARKLGDIAYAVLTANADMGDGAALFVAGHSNIATGADIDPPGIATLAAAILAMKLQKDLLGLRRLNIRPQFFIAPCTLEGTCEVLFRSGSFSDNDTIETDSSLGSTRNNPYAGNYFTRVYEPRLDDADPAAWYLAGPKGKTVKMFYLDGKKTPYLENRTGFTVDGFESKVRIDAGAKALHWAGLYYNAGT